MWKTRDEIVKTYTDHIHSLKLSGIEYDVDGIFEAFDKELTAWDEAHS